MPFQDITGPIPLKIMLTALSDLDTPLCDNESINLTLTLVKNGFEEE